MQSKKQFLLTDSDEQIMEHGARVSAAAEPTRLLVPSPRHAHSTRDIAISALQSRLTPQYRTVPMPDHLLSPSPPSMLVDAQ
jgi:hypothetical protein